MNKIFEMKFHILIILITTTAVSVFQLKQQIAGSKHKFKDMFLQAVNTYKDKVKMKDHKGLFISSL